MGITWNAEADAKLFAAVIKCHNIKLDYQAMAQEMGPDCTAKAIMHRVAKLRGNAQGTQTNTANNGEPSTPAKPGRKPKEDGSASKSTGKGGRKPAKANAEKEATPESPSVGRSYLPRSRSATVKPEQVNGADDEEAGDRAAKRVKTEDEKGDSDY